MCYSHITAPGEFCKKTGYSICVGGPRTPLSRAQKHLGFFHLSKKESKGKKNISTYKLQINTIKCHLSSPIPLKSLLSNHGNFPTKYRLSLEVFSRQNSRLCLILGTQGKSCLIWWHKCKCFSWLSKTYPYFDLLFIKGSLICLDQCSEWHQGNVLALWGNWSTDIKNTQRRRARTCV